MNEAIEVLADQVEEENVVSFVGRKYICENVKGMTAFWHHSWGIFSYSRCLRCWQETKIDKMILQERSAFEWLKAVILCMRLIIKFVVAFCWIIYNEKTSMLEGISPAQLKKIIFSLGLPKNERRKVARLHFQLKFIRLFVEAADWNVSLACRGSSLPPLQNDINGDDK